MFSLDHTAQEKLALIRQNRFKGSTTPKPKRMSTVNTMLAKVYSGFSDVHIIKIYKEAKEAGHVVPELKQEIENRMQSWISGIQSIILIDSKGVGSDKATSPYENELETFIHIMRMQGK